MKFFFLLMLIGSSSWAFDSGKCSGMMNNGLYKKYKWAGVGEANSRAMTAETKSAGIFVAPFKMSTEGSTATLDPKYSTNVSVSNTQSTSSYGACSALGLNERKEQRDLYVAQNLEQIRTDVAKGDGSHLEALSWFSLCEDQVQKQFNEALQGHMKELMSADAKDFNQNVDQVIRQNNQLSQGCYVLTAN